jgi:rubredoxin-NAD+ reductase
MCRKGMANYASFLKGTCAVMSNDGFKVWECIICGWIYDEQKGAPEEGLAPGTRWEDVPEFWVCPDCGAGKEDFEMIEM